MTISGDLWVGAQCGRHPGTSRVRRASGDLWGGEQVSRRSASAGLQPSVQSPQGGSRCGLVWRQAL